MCSVAAAVCGPWPEDFGLAADGFAPPRSRQTRRKPSHASGFSFKEALGERPFWLLVAAFPLFGVASIGIITHLMPLLTDRGLGSKWAAFVLSTMGLSVLLGRIVCGYLLDRVAPLIVAFSCLAGMASGTALLAASGGGIVPDTAVMLIGLGIGAEFDFMSYFVGRYFGCRDYGRIYGLIYGVYCLGSGTGPVIMGRVLELSGSYTAGVWLLSTLT
jgi:predicted MFS family arabinose efflux permease